MSGDQKKENINTMERKVFRESPNDELLSKAVCVENTDDNPIPTQESHSRSLKIFRKDIALVDVDTEIEQVLPDGTRRILIQIAPSKVAKLLISFVANGTNTNEYYTIDEGGFLDLDKLNLTNKSIFFQCDRANRTVQILTYIN